MGESKKHGHLLTICICLAIVFAVIQIVLMVVANKILQRESVVTRYEVDARRRTSVPRRKQVMAATEPLRELALGHRLASPKVAHRVPKLPVPLAPRSREVPELIPALAQVPRLSN